MHAQIMSDRCGDDLMRCEIAFFLPPSCPTTWQVACVIGNSLLQVLTG